MFFRVFFTIQTRRISRLKLFEGTIEDLVDSELVQGVEAHEELHGSQEFDSQVCGFMIGL